MFTEALAALEMNVTVDGDTFDIKLKPGDLIRFERQFKRSITDLVGEDGKASFGVEELAFMAYTALTRTDRFEGDFDSFLDRFDDVDLVGTDVDPTSAAG